MSTSLPSISQGVLPRGRWVADLESVEAKYVVGRSDLHLELWKEWTELKDALKNVLGRLPAAWLSGSFFTTKSQPGDIDCVFILDQRTLGKEITEQQQAFLELVVTSQVKIKLNLRVDSYAIVWSPWPGVNPPPEYKSALERRGYWDEFWARTKDTDPELAALPRRGYLEVIIDDYQR